MCEIAKRYFYFVRHGETDWNRRQLCQGQKDIPLNSRGFREAKMLASKCRGLNLACIVSSPLVRAMETARVIHQAHPHAALPIISELTERNWGSLEGISSEEMYAIEKLEERDPSYIPEDGVESRVLFRERIIKGIRIAQMQHPHPLIVSHGRVFLELCHILGIPPVRQIPNCQLLEFSHHSDGWKAQVFESL